MALEIQVTKAFEEALARRQNKKNVYKAVNLLLENPRHPSLNVHRLVQARDGIWVAYISDGDRVIYELKNNVLYLWNLGSHDIERVKSNHFAAHTRFSRMESVIEAPTIPVVETGPTPSKPLPIVKPPQPPIAQEQVGSANHFTFFQDAHLRVLGVPTHLLRRLKSAPTLEKALDLPELPEQTRMWLLEISTSAQFREIAFDSSLLLYRTTLDRLEGFCEGKIKRLMLSLERPEQQKYVDMEHAPLIVLKGVAGSGKTTVGIYRAIRQAEKGRRVLVLTFNPVLAATTKSLIEELIGPLPANLAVMHVQELMRLLLAEFLPGMTIRDERECNALLEKALAEVRQKINSPLLSRDRKFFQEEIKYVIKGHGLTTYEQYRGIERYGRKTALGPGYRAVMWQVYEAYTRRFAKSQTIDYYDVAMQALHALHGHHNRQRYDDIIVDEAQDLTIVDLRVLEQLVKTTTGHDTMPGTFLILADAAQTLYSCGFSWQQAGIQARGHTAILRKNHRNTRQVVEAAAQLIQHNVLRRESGEYITPEGTQRQGPPPLLIRATSTYNQIEIVRSVILDLVENQTFRLSDFALLCPTESLCEMSERELNNVGLRTMLYKNPRFDVLEEYVKIMTIQSAKGLEFPVVFLLGLTNDMLPSRQGMQHMEQEEAKLFLEQQRSLCYVGMTRAAEILYLVTTQGAESIFVRELEGKIRDRN